MKKKVTSVLMMAGGTGGHVFPALSIANECRDRGLRVSWLGTAAGIENVLVPQANFPFFTLPIRGLRGKRFTKLVTLPFALVCSFIKSCAVILKTNPQVVIGMGGYASGPGGLAAVFLRKRLIIHEQNAVMGLTNRLLSKIASKTLIAFPATANASLQAECVGNPVRPEIVRLPSPAVRYTARTGPLRLLIIGGSLGANVFNETLPLALPQLSFSVEVWHQTGKAGFSATEARFKEFFPKARVTAFIDNMAEAYAWADLVICRAGALTIAELMSAGVASILIPYLYAVDDHQTKNAQTLVQSGGALLLPQPLFSPASLVSHLHSVCEREILLKMALMSYQGRENHATKKVVDLCLV